MDAIKPEERYFQLFLSMSHGALIHDAQGQILESNPAAERLLGLTADQLKGKSSGNPRWKVIHADGSDFPMTEHPAVIALKTGQSVKDVSMGVYHPDKDRWLWLLVNAEPLINPKAGKTELIFTTFTDITAQKGIEQAVAEKEELYRSLVESTDAGVFMLNADGQYLYTNIKAGLPFGYTPEQMTGKTVHELHAPEMAARMIRDVNAVLTGNKGFVTEEKTDLPSGTRYYRISVQPVRNSAGEPVAVLMNVMDITRLKEADILIQASEKKYKTLFFESPDAYLIIRDGIFVECNRASERMLLGSREDLIGKSPVDFSPEYQPNGRKSAEYAEELIRDAYQKGRSSFEWQHIRRDGQPFIAQINLSVIEYDGASVLFVTWYDVTETRRVQNELHESEERLRLIAEQSQTIVWQTDEKGKYTYVSPLCQSILGYSPEELVNQKYFFELIPDEYTEEYKNIGFRMADETGKLTNYLTPIRTHNGRVLWMSNSGSPIRDSQGNITGYRGASIDVTERRRAEEEIAKFRIMADQANYGMAMVDLGGHLTYLNNAFAEIHGFTPEELIGKNLAILHTEEQLAKVTQLIQKIQSEGGFKSEELWRRRKDGSVFPSLMSANLIFDQEKKPRFMSASVIDISEIKKAEERILELNATLENKIQERTRELEESNAQLLKARNEAEQANQAKSDFLSRMSHELRTPMNSILGFAQLLEMSDLNATQLKGVSHILRSGKHLLELINEVLDIARIEAGRVSLSIEPVEVFSVVSEVADIMQMAARSRSIQLENSVDPDSGYYFKSDRQRVKQILLNLVNNAVKYNREGGSIRITCESKLDANSRRGAIRISVSDTGMGIAAEDLDKVFVPFERIGADKTTTEGTGLGLAVVKKLIEIMGGEVGLESEVNVGSTFWFELPRSLSEFDRLEHDGIKLSGLEVEEKKAGQILYIEDNQANIDLVEQVLASSRPNIRLISSKEGGEAVLKAKSHKPALILLDLNLPDMHGYEVFKMLQADQGVKEIPVVVISADAMPGQLKAMLQLGVSNYLTKPIDITVLLKEIDRYI